MSLKIGGSKSKTKTTSNTVTNSTTTPTVPDWASNLTQSVAGRVGGLNGLDPRSLVAPSNALQDRAALEAGGLTGQFWNFDGAADLIRGAAGRDASTYAPSLGAASNVGASSLLDNLDAYMSPYRKDVVDAVLGDFDYGAGQTRAQQDLDLAGAGAFGGSGAALTRSMTEDALTRGRATTSANLRDQMFQRGSALSADDANRRQQAAMANAAAANQFGLANLTARNEASQFNAGAVEQASRRQMDAAKGLTDLSTTFEANQRANIATKAGLGDTFRGIDQEQRQAPVTSTQQLVAMLQGLPINLFTGSEKAETQASTGTEKTKGSSFSAGASVASPFKGLTGIGL